MAGRSSGAPAAGLAAVRARARSRILALEDASADPDPSREIIIPGEQSADRTRRIIVPGRPVRDPTRQIIRPGATPARPRDARSLATIGRLTPTAIANILAADGDRRLLADFCHRAGLSGCGVTGTGRNVAQFRPDARSLPRNIQLGPLRRQVRDAQGRTRNVVQHSVVRRTEFGRRSGDPVVNEAFDKAGVVLSFFRNVLGRQGLDGTGALTRSVVHVGRNVDNAEFDANDVPHVEYGDGNATTRPLTSSNFPYHELGHGVIDSTVDLLYERESGALNEHFADVIAVTIDQWEHAQTVDEADFSIGRGGSYVRNPQPPTRMMGDPHAGDMPGHVREARRYALTDDEGGVHTLVGIPNRAFFGAAQRLGGYVWNHVGLVWYAALRDRIGPTETFQGAAQATVDTAVELFGRDSREVAAVRGGWSDVGIFTSLRTPPDALRGLPQVTPP